MATCLLQPPSIVSLLSLLAILLGYLLGSVAFAVLVSRAFRLPDPHTYGSGNPGATNVLRSGSKAAALLTLLGDAAKGAVAVLLARLAGLDATTVALVGLAAFVGHLAPVFFRFRGGKGVATAAGVLLALDLWLGLATLATWLIIAFFFRYSSLAAIVAAVFAPAYAFFLFGTRPLVLVVAVMALLLLLRHRTNIRKLLAGEETRLGERRA